MGTPRTQRRREMAERLTRRFFQSYVTKTHLIHGKVFVYSWRGNRHRHVILYVFGLYLPVWR